MPANKIKLAQIPTLTFHSDRKTAARRTAPIPQLACKGPACKRFQPDAVQCYNMGGAGNDVQWRCEADLPEGIRMGGVEVSCEGWARPGDEYVLKGSCGLEYRLVELPGYTSRYGTPPGTTSAETVQKYIFWLFFWGVAAWLVYKLATHILAPFFPSGVAGAFSGRRPPPGGGGGWWDWFSGSGGGGRGGSGGNGGTGGNNSRRNPRDAPPPYPGSQPPPSAQPKPSASASDAWRPGFWTGLGLGGAAAAVYNTRRRWAYDWEREGYYGPGAGLREAPRAGWGWGWGAPAAGYGGYGGGPRERVVYVREEERGPASAGPSRPRASGGDRGEMRRSMGYGGSNVR